MSSTRWFAPMFPWHYGEKCIIKAGATPQAFVNIMNSLLASCFLESWPVTSDSANSHLGRKVWFPVVSREAICVKPHELRITPAFREVISSILYKTGKLLGLAPFLSKMKVQMYNQGRGTGFHQPPQSCSVMLAVHMSLYPHYFTSMYLVRNSWMLFTGGKNLLERVSYHSFSSLFPFLSILALQVCKTTLM